MKTKPETDEQKYIFLVDNQDLAFSLIGAGFLTVALLPAEDGYHSLESFAAYMEEIAYAGTYQMDYCYVTACYGKKYNDFLEQMLHKNFLTVRQGWYLFKEKKYLQKLEHMQEIKSLLGDYIKRFERRPDDTPD